MAEPSWYKSWRHDAVHDLIDKNKRLEAEFKIGTWARYDYDLDNARMTFSHEGKIKLAADVQIVGTTSTSAGNWLWAWANDWWPKAVGEYANSTRLFGEKHGISELATPRLEDESLENLGWELSAAAARVSGAKGAYRAPTANGYLFLLYRDIAFAM